MRRVLLSEASSLTAREHVTVLGRSGVHVDVMSSDPMALCRWSRWVRRVHPCPAAGADPAGYLDAVSVVLAADSYDALLPTHEQAWLFAAGRDRLPAEAPLAVADLDAFDRVQSKLAFAALLDDLGLAQPRWRAVSSPSDLAGSRFPYYLKTPFSTAGRGVRFVRTSDDRETALADLGFPPAGGLMAQDAAAGGYGQVQALFDRGRMVAVHTSVQVGEGMGGSAAARLSVDHPLARDAAARVGEALGWHGGLTLDYLHVDGRPTFIECNPRTVEPGNAAASGVDLPMLGIDLAAGLRVPGPLRVGRAGVRTHGTLALLLGTAGSPRPRRTMGRTIGGCVLKRGVAAGSGEVMTPLLRDPPSLVPVVVVVASLLARPSSAARTADRSIEAYAVGPDAVDLVRDPRPGSA
jgi:hypothetical protein